MPNKITDSKAFIGLLTDYFLLLRWLTLARQIGVLEAEMLKWLFKAILAFLPPNNPLTRRRQPSSKNVKSPKAFT